MVARMSARARVFLGGVVESVGVSCPSSGGVDGWGLVGNLMGGGVHVDGVWLGKNEFCPDMSGSMLSGE